MTGGEYVRANIVDALAKLKPLAMAKFAQDQHVLEDLLQQTALQAIEKAEQFTPGTSLLGWLYVIMRNINFTRYRRQAHRTTADIADVPEGYLGVSGGQEAAMCLRDVNEALKVLSPEQRSVLMAASTQLTYDEIAAREHVSVGTIKSRLWRARTRLQEALA